MSARNETHSPRLPAGARKRQLAALRKKHPLVAAEMDAEDATTAALRLPRKPIIDLAYTSRHSKVEVKTGSLDDSVEAGIDLCIDDGRSSVEIIWTLERWQRVNGKYQRSEPYPSPHTDMSFEVDEIEAFATALYEAVQRAKSAGYLPAVTEGSQT